MMKNMFIFYSFFLFICTGVLQGAVIPDTFKDEGGGSDNVTNQAHSKERYYEYALDKSYHDLEYLKISILSKTKFSDIMPSPREIWTNKTVPYIIYTKSSIKEKAIILKVIKLMNSKTCIHFVERSDEEVFITITPKTRLKNTLCHRRGNNMRRAKVSKGILTDLKFALDFKKRIGKHNVKEISETLFQAINYSIDQKFKSLNSFYNCKEDGLKFKNQNDAKKTLVHYRKKRSNGKANNGAIITTEPNIPIKTVVTFHPVITEKVDSTITRDDDYADYIDDSELTENPLSTVITPNGIIPITVSDIIQDLQISETITQETNGTILPLATGDETLQKITKIPSATNNVHRQPPFPVKPSKVAYDPYGRMESPEKPVLSDGAEDNLNDTQTTITVEEEFLAVDFGLTENPLSTVITPNGIIPINVSDIIQDLKISETSGSILPLATGDETLQQSTKIPPAADNVYRQPPFPDIPSKVAHGPNGRMESPEKPILSDGAKDIYLNDTQVIIVEEAGVHEHKLGIDDKHLHHRLGTYVGFESSKGLDGFHKMDIVGENPIQFRTVLKNPAKLWTDGVIPFVLSDKYDQRQKQLLTEGIEQFLNKTCVQFVERTNEETYINIAPDSRCSATIGKIEGGINNVTLSDGCFLPGTIVHELMHVLGFIHEQNRPDRDSFVMIAWDNIIESARPNFRKYRKGQVQDFGVGYDYDSVMHYGMYDFAKDLERPTIIPLQSGTMIGQRDGFSQKDLLKVKRLFECEEAQAPQEEEVPQEEVLPESGVGFRKRKQKTPAGANFRSKFLRYLKKLFKSLYASLVNFTKVSI